MLNIVWICLVLTSVVFGIINGRVHEVVMAITDSAKLAFDVALGMAGMMTLWLGIMKIAEDSGLVELMTKCLHPVLRRLFPDVPSDHPAMGAMALNITANILGLTNAATPFGIKAMEELNKLNPFSGTATDAMCMFLAINTSSVQLIPASAIAFLSAAGARNPTDIVFSTLLATSCSTIVAIIAVTIFRKRTYYRKEITSGHC
ncbi:MAG: nucleoside recognition domain-containing protein [Pseudomonadota bacterium]|nr:nucleoside recognition domain-containing protein [Pseudomonadota bacterium]